MNLFKEIYIVFDLIADVAAKKHHQRQDKTLYFFTRTLLESEKLFFCCNVQISNKRMPCECAYYLQAHKQMYAVRTGLH